LDLNIKVNNRITNQLDGSIYKHAQFPDTTYSDREYTD